MRISRERKPKGSRPLTPLVGAILAGLAASAASWQVSRVDGASLTVMLLAILVALVAGSLWRVWWYRTPYDIGSRVSYRLSTWPHGRWLDRAFLGYGSGWFHEPRVVMGKLEDSVGTIGPTRVNKTSGVALAQILFWKGSLVSISQTPLLFRGTATRRRQLAKLHEGRVMVYAPNLDGRVEGVVPVRFSPADSTDPNVIMLRVASWTQSAATGKNVEDSDHWRSGASRILRGLFLACACHPDRAKDFTLVREWLSSRNLADPIAILRGLRTWAGDEWADELRGVEATPDKERGSFYSAASTTIDATSNPLVSRSTVATDFDPEEFVRTRSTLYIFTPTEHQRSLAPLIGMLVESITHTAYRLHRDGELNGVRLALSIDDMANVAPLPQLESIISQGGGQGVNVWWSLQSLAQLAHHYGLHAAQAIWSATRCKIIFGGLTDELSIERLSEVLPEERVVLAGEQETQEGHGSSVKLGQRRSLHTTYRRLLSAAQLREIPDTWALLLYHNHPPRMVHEPLAVKRHLTRRHMKAWQIEEQAALEVVLVRGEVVPLHRVKPSESEEETGS